MNKDIRIMLIDGRELVRQDLQHMLEQEEGMNIVGNYAGAEKAFSEMVRLHPDIVLMGTQMPGMNWIEATHTLKRNGLNFGGDVIILAESVDYRAEALKAGATSCLLKDMTHVELVQAIKEVYWNKQLPEYRDGLVEEVVGLVIPPPANAAHLLRFMHRLGEILHDNLARIICTAGSWDRGAVVALTLRPTTLVDLLKRLENMPEVEKVEEEPTAKGVFSSFSRNWGALSRLGISANKRICVTLKETIVARQELVAVLN